MYTDTAWPYLSQGKFQYQGHWPKVKVKSVIFLILPNFTIICTYSTFHLKVKVTQCEGHIKTKWKNLLIVNVFLICVMWLVRLRLEKYLHSYPHSKSQSSPLVRTELVEGDMDVWFADSDLNYDSLICNQSSVPVNDTPSNPSRTTGTNIRPEEIKGFEDQFVQS